MNEIDKFGCATVMSPHLSVGVTRERLDGQEGREDEEKHDPHQYHLGEGRWVEQH